MKKTILAISLFIIGSSVVYLLINFQSSWQSLWPLRAHQTAPTYTIPEVTSYLSTTSSTQTYPLVFASIPYWDQTRAFESFKKNVASIDFVSLFWYYLTAEGDIQTYESAHEDERIRAFANEKGVKVFALIANLPGEDGDDWDWKRVDRVIADPESRKQHVDDIIELMERKKFDGINIDYESLRDKQRDDFSAFIAELGRELHMRGKLLNVAIHPRTSNDDHAYGQDWKTLGETADQLAFMTYEEHWKKSDPGPIASIGWVERVMMFALASGVPREKIYLGLPLYGYDWPLRKIEFARTASGLEYDDVARMIDEGALTPRFDEASASPFFEYTKNGTPHVVWFENGASVTAKLSVAEAYGLGGIALWRLGGEDQQAWEAIADSESHRR